MQFVLDSCPEFQYYFQSDHPKTRPSALGISDPVMEPLENLGTPEFPRILKTFEGHEGDAGDKDEEGEDRGKREERNERDEGEDHQTSIRHHQTCF